MIDALDSFVSTSVRHGENGHLEFDWSNDLQEKVVQFDFQCVRTDESGVASLSIILDGLLSRLSMKQNSPEKELLRKELLVSLYKIIGKTRDVEGGKGEYTIAYMMIHVWYKYFPKLSALALSLFVFPPTHLNLLFPLDVIGTTELNDQIPYGSWKDIKYFCNYIKKQGNSNHPLIETCVTFINMQIHLDEESLNGGQKISLVGKWVPRESSEKFGWMFESLATNYFTKFMESAKTPESKAKAVKKCKVQYRILCSKMNKHLDTVQIKQCSKVWSTIEHAKTTSITMAKQRKAFLNQKKTGSDPRTNDHDRVVCAENLRAYLESLKKEGKEVKGKNVGLEMFAAQALGMLDYSYEISSSHREVADILNSQWRDNGDKKNADGLGPIIPIVDTSGSMSGDPLCAAISLGCRVAEKSILGSRVMTFSAEPAWINLDGNDTFVDKVSAIMKKSNTAGNITNFYKALNLILTVIEERRILPDDVENMILAIFSDMQIDDNLHAMTSGATNYNPTELQKTEARGKWATMFEQIKSEYADTGMRIYGKPLNPPHILFWNLRKTEGFPTISTEANCSMMSGFDPTILNLFCELGMDAIKGLTPYKMLMKQLDNPRYAPLETVIRASLISS